jgi:WD40 repeat protein
MDDLRFRELEAFSSEHAQALHCAVFDHYGRRLATAGADGELHLWQRDANENNERFAKVASWKPHSGPVYKVGWAHPEFGQLLASASLDRNVKVWQEPTDTHGNGAWDERANLLDARMSVLDLCFAPRHLGLKLALCSLDGYVRIYQCADMIKLNYWQLSDEFEACKNGCSALAWNPSRIAPEHAVVAVGDVDGRLALWEQAPGMRTWRCAAAVDRAHEGAVTCVSWAPSMGRAYHMIATCGKDTSVKLYYASWSSETGWSLTLGAQLPGHAQEVQKVEFNATGTLLASSSDDGELRMWARNGMGEWKHVSIVQ